MSTYSSVNERRKNNWNKNALRYFASRLYRGSRDKNLWIFSAWEGQKYADNAKYLFEYIQREHPEHVCIWQTANHDVYERLQKENIPVQLLGTDEAIATQKKAGVAIYTNGLDDFGTSPYVYGAVLVCLWHGVCFKKMHRALLADQKTLRAFLGKMKYKFFSWIKRDITITTSEYAANQHRTGFLLKPSDKIILAGQARNDVFAENLRLEDVIHNVHVLERIKGKKIVLYMPTFRKDNTKLINSLRILLSSIKVQETLKKQEVILLCKLHYLCRADLDENETCIFLNDNDVEDVQKLMAISDFLITDYSSSATDYALLRRPILFFINDWEEYGGDQTMMPETLEVCGVNCARNTDEFISQLTQIISNPERGIAQADALNKVFDETHIPIGSFSKANYEAIMGVLTNTTKKKRSIAK